MRPTSRLRLLVTILALWCFAGPMHAEVVAVSSVVFNGYARQRLPDGSFKPEAYVFGEGGRMSRPVADPAMEQLKFADVARVVAGPLAKQNYHPALKTSEVQLLIVVFWGSTQGSRDTRNQNGSMDRLSSASSNYTAARADDQANQPNSPEPSPATSAAQNAYDSALWQMQMDNDVRDRIDNENAQILGYSESLSRARFARHMAFAQDTLAEVSDNRYYVVLQAYDFKTAKDFKKLKPLWTTRMSVSESGPFGPALEKMVKNAARSFGTDTDGLQRRREGTVDLAPLKILEVDPARK